MFFVVFLALSLKRVYAAYLPPQYGRGLSDLEPLACECQDTRSIAGIVWNSVSIWFLCSWVVIHPNIPPPHDTWFRKTLRRLGLMLYQLLLPELVLLWAARQWLGARSLSITFKGSWTMTHAFYLIMGGFTLYRDEENLGVLTVERFRKLYDSGDIDLPSVPLEDIEDRSKSDDLAKLVTILQTAWFIIQCVGRAVKGMAITEFEVVTLAQCFFTAALYYFWWHKPMDVCYSTKLALKPRPESPEPTATHVQPITVRWVVKSSFVEYLRTGTFSNPLPILHDVEFRSRKLKIPNPLSILKYFAQALLSPFLLLAASLLWIINLCARTASSIVSPPDASDATTGPECIPLFYSPRQLDDQSRLGLAFLFAVTGTLFGGLHCIAWSFDMPTVQERILWRVSSSFLTIFPTLVLASITGYSFVNTLMTFGSFPDRRGVPSRSRKRARMRKAFLDALRGVFMVLLVIVLSCAPIARLYLLFDAFALLRDPADSALLDFSWTDFFPHV